MTGRSVIYGLHYEHSTYLLLDPDHIVMTGRKIGLESYFLGEECVVQEKQKKGSHSINR